MPRRHWYGVFDRFFFAYRVLLLLLRSVMFFLYPRQHTGWPHTTHTGSFYACVVDVLAARELATLPSVAFRLVQSAVRTDPTSTPKVARTAVPREGDGRHSQQQLVPNTRLAPRHTHDAFWHTNLYANRTRSIEWRRAAGWYRITGGSPAKHHGCTGTGE